jgi:hypothetical protein
MSENSPTIKEWRELYESVVRVKELAPWEWMTEADIFGVQNPETDELGFVSVMGMLGEHYAMSLYLGPEGLYEFWDFEEIGHLASPEGLLEIPQLQASFENRDELHKKDREVIKELGLKFRGRHAWPMFRSYRPGFAPWFLKAEEARFLTYALNQLTDVAPRFREDPSLLEPPADESYLVRVPRRADGTLVWEDHLTDVPPPEPSPIPIEMDPQVLEDLKRLPRSRNRLEMDFFMFPAPIQEKKEARPFFPYMLLTVDAQSGMVLGNELLKPDPSLEAMWGSIPATVAHQLAGAGIVPEEVTVGSELLFQLLQPLAESLRFKLEQSQILPNLHPVKELLFQAIYE